MLSDLRFRLRALFRRDAMERDLNEEIRFHFEHEVEKYKKTGMSDEEAKRRARMAFGGHEQVKEDCREARGTSLVESTQQDLRYAARQLWANPTFAIVIILTLALSIGANSAIFSVVDGVLLKPLPYPQANRIVRIFLTNAMYPRFPLNPFDFRDYRARSKSFESLAAFTRRDLQLSGGSAAPAQLNGFEITAGYFRVLGLRPELGREFNENAELPGNGRLVILSDRLWRTRFGAAPDIVGRRITLNMQPYTVVGVMPPDMEHPGNEYHSLPYGKDVDVWSPFTFAGDPSRRGSHYIEGIGRLKDGVTPGEAEAELNSIMTELGREHDERGWNVLVVPLYREIVGSSQKILLVLLGAVGMVLLIACANAANLMLARAAMRRRELAVRLALGAQRARLIRQLLTESLLISLLGGALGLAMAVGGVKALVSLLPVDFPRAHEIHINAPVFVFTFLVSATVGILFGLIPAIQASRTDPKQGLHEGGRTSTGSGRQSRLRNVLVISEVSLACVLLIGAGLMLRSFLNLLHLNPGFQEKHVLTASLSLPEVEYKTPAEVARFYDELATKLSSLPGVESAGAGTDLPWTGYDENLGGFTIEGKQPPPHEFFHGRYHVATPDYFRALGIPLLEGRFFTDADKSGAPNVVIINQEMAEKYWPHEDAVGKRIDFFADHPTEKDWYRVIGVVGDVKDKPNSPAAEPAFWWSNLQQLWPIPEMSVVVRADSDPRSLVDAVREQVKRMNPSLAVADVRLMDQIVDGSVATPRFAFVLVGLFAGLAIVLAAIGTYGVIAYSVSQRTPEFGLRMALGAQRLDVLRLVLMQAAGLILTGTASGVVLALIFARVLKSLIYEVSPADPLTFTSVGLMVIAVAILACYLPARRATKADPMIALRAE
ncbi:MAG TPA: ABC transporter permease [Acidobacteriaceae bacterium]|jgi:predicted permease|nr:ABC transporter permease [Acidobacteriaceae bacterium]